MAAKKNSGEAKEAKAVKGKAGQKPASKSEQAGASREIRRAVDTGKTRFGSKEAEKSLKNGTAKLLIIAGNCPKLAVEKLVSFAEAGKIPVYNYAGTGLELGSVCGKPFTVSAMVVMDEGKSKLLEIAKE